LVQVDKMNSHFLRRRHVEVVAALLEACATFDNI
jgi:hypothetical protein